MTCTLYRGPMGPIWAQLCYIILFQKALLNLGFNPLYRGPMRHILPSQLQILCKNCRYIQVNDLDLQVNCLSIYLDSLLLFSRILVIFPIIRGVLAGHQYLPSSLFIICSTWKIKVKWHILRGDLAFCLFVLQFDWRSYWRYCAQLKLQLGPVYSLFLVEFY